MRLHRNFNVAEKKEATNVHCLKSKDGYVVIAQVGRTLHKDHIKAQSRTRHGFKVAKNAAKRYIRANFDRVGKSYE